MGDSASRNLSSCDPPVICSAGLLSTDRTACYEHRHHHRHRQDCANTPPTRFKTSAMPASYGTFRFTCPDHSVFAGSVRRYVSKLSLVTIKSNTAYGSSRRPLSHRLVSPRCEADPRKGRTAADCVESKAGGSIDRRSLIGLTVAAFISDEENQSAMAGSEAEGCKLSGEALKSVREAVASSVPKVKGPAVLRVLFHDAGTYSVETRTGGANGSIRFETKRPENKGIKRGLNCISEAMTRIQGGPAEGLVSYADMICICSAYAVEATGGPIIDVSVGRQDTTKEDPTGRLPAETLPISDLKANFLSKGFSCQEFVALCGSHTIGGKGFGEPLSFDNAYYKALLTKPWDDPTVEMREMIGLPSDRVLADDKECLPYIQMYADNQDAFYNDFSKALIKLTNSGATWATLA